MKKHIAEDLPARKHPQAEMSAQSKKSDKPESGGKGSDKGEKSPEQRIRQAIYDIRYRSRREDIPLRSAYSQYMQNSSMSEAEKAGVRAKLFGKGGMQAEDFEMDMKMSAANATAKALYQVFVEKKTEVVDINQLKSALEEAANITTSADKKYKVRVTDKKTGNTYVRFATRDKITQLRSRGLEVEMTEYGTPYEGEKKRGEQTAAALGGGAKKAKRDYDEDGKVESSAKEHAGAVHNAIQRKKGLPADGKDTTGIKEELVGGQNKIDVAAPYGKLTSADFKKLRQGKGKNIKESKSSNPEKIDIDPKLKNKVVVSPNDNSTVKLMAHTELGGNVIVETGYSKFLNILQEKAESEQQQKLFGLALSVKRGQTPRSEASAEVLKIVDSMSEKKIRDFAKTKHAGLPVKVQKEEKESEESCESSVEQRDKRGDYAKINLVKNKLRSALGVKNPMVMVASEETISEEEYDRVVKDTRLERGGVGGNVDYGRPPRQPAPGTQRKRKRRTSAPSAMDIVRAEIEKKHGKGSLM